VIGAPSGPRFMVLVTRRVGGCILRLVAVDPRREALHTIRVKTRVKENDRIFEKIGHFSALTGCQIIGNQQGRIAATGLVAVDWITHVLNRRQRLRIYLVSGFWINPFLSLRFYFVQSREIGGIRNGQTNQRPVFVGSAIFFQCYPVTRSVQSTHITQQLVVWCMPFSYTITKPSGRRWNIRVVRNQRKVVFYGRILLWKK